MGTDNLFHSRKAKKSSDLARRKAKRESYERILIVCEGGKTEPNYFNELKNTYKLSTANVEVDGKCGSAPENVFDKAKELYLNEKNSGNPFDKVFCVFDKDSHTTYEKTVEMICNYKPKEIFSHVISIPCFEFWLLLHFKLTTKPFSKTEKKSVCDCVVHDLKKYIPDYEKGNSGIFDQLYDQLDFAKHNALRINKQATDDSHPSTMIYELVDYLKNLKS